jgi:predicted alpha/beta hydrolase
VTVLISPAMAVHSGFYKPLVDSFAAHGWGSRVVPRRGFDFGDVPASRTNDWSYDDERATLAAEIALEKAAGRNVIVLGHSLGGQIAIGLQQRPGAADGFVGIGTGIPWALGDIRSSQFHGGEGLLGLAVPVVTRALGYWPKPGFGGPGPATLMREWAGMLRNGRLPGGLAAPVTTPSLLITLDGDGMAAASSTVRMSRMIAPSALTTWTYTRADAPDGAELDHLRWVRSPDAVVTKIIDWWNSR